MQLENLDGIASNFRCKKVVCQNNLIENIDGLKKFKFLETLLLGNNQLRDLDKFLVHLTKFAFLKQLDLFGNPLAEEPDYRMKIIYLMPQVLTLDRHVVTVQERIKAKRICEDDYGLSQGSGPVAKSGATGESPLKKKNTQKGNGKKKDGFSAAEKDLYREYNQIQKRIEKENAEEEERRKQFLATRTYESAPTPNFIIQN